VLTSSRQVDECGISLVHFSAQPERLLSLKPLNHPTYPKQRAYVKPKSGPVYAPTARHVREGEERGYVPDDGEPARGVGDVYDVLGQRRGAGGNIRLTDGRAVHVQTTQF
jgi:hypothetical protein